MEKIISSNVKINIRTIPDVITNILNKKTVLSGGALLKLATHDFNFGNNTGVVQSQEVKEYIKKYKYVENYRPTIGILKIDFDIYTTEDPDMIIKYFLDKGFNNSDIDFVMENSMDIDRYIRNQKEYGRYVCRLTNGGIDVDIIFVNMKHKCKKPSEFIIREFDFSFIKMWYDGTNVHFASQNVVDDICTKKFYLDFHPDMSINRHKQIMTVYRIFKYTKRGYIFMGFRDKPIKEFFDGVALSNIVKLYELPNNNVHKNTLTVYKNNIEHIKYVDKLLSLLRLIRFNKYIPHNINKNISFHERKIANSCYAYKLLKKYSNLYDHRLLDIIEDPENYRTFISSNIITNSHDPKEFFQKILRSINNSTPNIIVLLNILLNTSLQSETYDLDGVIEKISVLEDSQNFFVFFNSDFLPHNISEWGIITFSNFIKYLSDNYNTEKQIKDTYNEIKNSKYFSQSHKELLIQLLDSKIEFPSDKKILFNILNEHNKYKNLLTNEDFIKSIPYSEMIKNDDCDIFYSIYNIQYKYNLYIIAKKYINNEVNLNFITDKDIEKNVIMDDSGEIEIPQSIIYHEKLVINCTTNRVKNSFVVLIDGYSIDIVDFIIVINNPDKKFVFTVDDYYDFHNCKHIILKKINFIIEMNDISRLILYHFMNSYIEYKFL